MSFLTKAVHSSWNKTIVDPLNVLPAGSEDPLNLFPEFSATLPNVPPMPRTLTTFKNSYLNQGNFTKTFLTAGEGAGVETPSMLETPDANHPAVQQTEAPTADQSAAPAAGSSAADTFVPDRGDVLEDRHDHPGGNLFSPASRMGGIQPAALDRVGAPMQAEGAFASTPNTAVSSPMTVPSNTAPAPVRAAAMGTSGPVMTGGNRFMVMK